MIYAPFKFSHMKLYLIKLSRHVFVPLKDLGNAIQLGSKLGVVYPNTSLALALAFSPRTAIAVVGVVVLMSLLAVRVRSRCR